ncbi:MAG TPA: EamA family transporter [Terriglobales bacterium]|nr:EamA family transporter [Terriglobales bacterium]
MTATQSQTPSRVMVLLAFIAIYVIWGSTYLAIRYAVETIPPLMTAAARHLTAGSILFVWAWSRGFRPTRTHWIAAVKIGALYFLVGHGLLHWAEQHVASGLAALLIATEPMIIAALAVMAGQERLTFPTVMGMLLGLLGVGVLMGGGALHGSAELAGIVAVLLSAVAWSVGVHFSRRVALPEDSLAASAMTLLCGSALLWVVASLTGEFTDVHTSQVSMRSVLGLLYLIFFGTIIAFTSYTWLLSHTSATVVSTHTYVNPVVAVLLGWALAGEPLNARVIIAGTVILGSVVLIRRGTRARQVSEELAACEQ